MFNVGGGEMMMLAILALLVFGPEGLPGIIKNVMRVVKAVRTAAADFQTEVRSALDEENLRQDRTKRQRKPAPVESRPVGEARAAMSAGAAGQTEASLPPPPAEGAQGALPVAPESLVTERTADDPQALGAEQADAQEPVAEGESSESKGSEPREAADAQGRDSDDTEDEKTSTEKEETPASPQVDPDDDGPGLPMVMKKVGETA